MDLPCKALEFSENTKVVIESRLIRGLILCFLMFIEGNQWIRLLTSKSDVLTKISKVVNSQTGGAVHSHT